MSSKSKVSLYVVAQIPLLIEGIRSVLTENSEIKFGGSSVNSIRAVRDLQHEKHDVCLLDVDMPGISAISIIRRVILDNPDCRVLAYSRKEEGEQSMRFLWAGAFGFVSKMSPVDEILNAIILVSRGGKYFGSATTEAMINTSRRNQPGNRDLFNEESQLSDPNLPHSVRALSDREFEIMMMVGERLSSKEIAKQLNISPKTVSTHVTNIVGKLNLKRRADIIHFVLTNDL